MLFCGNKKFCYDFNGTVNTIFKVDPGSADTDVDNSDYKNEF